MPTPAGTLMGGGAVPTGAGAMSPTLAPPMPLPAVAAGKRKGRKVRYHKRRK